VTSTDLKRLRKEIAGKLSLGNVRTFIGWEKGSNAFRSRPGFFRTPDEAENAIFSPACTPTLVRMVIEDIFYPLDGPDNRKPLGIVLRGCDDKGVVELIKDNKIRREDVFIIGVDCPGTVDWKKVRKIISNSGLTVADLADGDLVWKDRQITLVTNSGEKSFEGKDVLMSKCLECENHTPRIYDILIGEEDRDRRPSNPPKQVVDLEGEEPNDRWEYWEDVFGRCIRCFSCRNICTYCYCEECAIDPTTLAIDADTLAEEKAERPQWVGRDSTVPSNAVYLMMRAYHGSGRCTSCEECDRSCPMGLPLRLLNRKVRKDVKELFDYDAGENPDDKLLLGDSCDTDPGDFIW